MTKIIPIKSVISSTEPDPNWYVTPDLCTPCGGKCCKSMPGAAYPEDFPTKELLESALKSGRWAIDWWEGDARPGMFELGVTMYVRPAIKGFENQLRHPAWGGECTFLTPSGCELTANQRPKECRYLKPEYDSGPKCKTHGGINKQTAAIAWLDRADELE